MEDTMIEELAKQLRRPDGDFGRQVGERMNEGNRFMNEQAIVALGLQDGMSVLEIGMGNGWFIRQILAGARNIRYTGCDYSDTMISEAEIRNQDFVRQGVVTLHKAEAKQLPFGSNSFDRILTVNTLYFWEQPIHELTELKRVLKPEGRLIIAIRPENCMKHLPVTAFGFRLYSTETLLALLREAGFDIVESTEHLEQSQQFGDSEISMASAVIIAQPHREAN